MSFYEEKNPADISISQIYPHIKKFLPNVRKKNINFFYHGTYNVFEINSKYILRIPDREFRNKNGLEMLIREQKMLNFLLERLTIEIPEILFLNESENLPFSIHKKIPGKSLIFKFNELSESEKKVLTKSIGKFLSKLHSNELKENYIQEILENKYNENELLSNFRKFWEKRYKTTKEIAFKYLSNREKNWLIDIFEEYLNDDSNFRFIPKLCHNDFDTTNILVSEENYKITGIIDFEDCRLWDPAADLLFFNEGKDFIKSILENYSFANQQSLKQRMKFMFCRTCCPYIIWGVNHNRPGMIKEGKRKIKKNMELFP